MDNQTEAKSALMRAWPHIVKECRQVLGSELHYQAMLYHCLRQYGKVPIGQIGMNVKMAVENPQSDLFKELEARRLPDFQGEFEPIPDVVIFKHSIKHDWRRRNNKNTLTHMLMAIEVKASELEKSRIGPKMITNDIDKLAALREEVRNLGRSVVPVMMVIDTAPKVGERMVPDNVPYIRDYAKENGVELFYFSCDEVIQPDW